VVIGGAEANTLTLKSIEDAIKIKNQIITKVECASRTHDKEKRIKKLRFVVIGGGPTGVELAAELQEFISETFSKYYTKELIDGISIYLVDRGSELVSTFSKKIREESLKVLKQKGIKVVLNASVKKISQGEIVLADDTTIQTETIVWVAGIKPRDLTFDTPIEKSTNGKILINKYLQILGHEDMFAIGDAAAIEESPNALPALAQAAEQESEYVAKNIKFILENKPLKEFKYKSAGTLMSLGRWMAVGELFGIKFSGAFAWWIWRTVYLSKLISFKKKIKVALDWSINIISSRDISQI
jgi:NADH dehydrogenase